MNNLLDRIETKQSEHFGIIDFVNKRQIIFYDLSHESSPDYRLMVMAWRAENPDMRFSIYCIMNFPEIHLPSPVVFSRNSILNQEELDLTKTIINIQSKRAVIPK